MNLKLDGLCPESQIRRASNAKDCCLSPCWKDPRNRQAASPPELLSEALERSAAAGIVTFVHSSLSVYF